MDSAHFSSLVKEAVTIACKSFDQHIDARLGNRDDQTLLQKLEGDFSADTQFTLEQLEQELEESQRELLALTEGAANASDLLNAFDEYIYRQVDALFFINNDVPTARIKREMSEQCVIALEGILRAKGLLDQPTQEGLHRLIELYDLSIASQMLLQRTVKDQTQGATSSLLEWAAIDLMNRQNSAPVADPEADLGENTRAMFTYLNGAHKRPKNPSAEEISRHARGLYNGLLNRIYQADYTAENPAHPVMLQVLATAANAAERRARLRMTAGSVQEDFLQAHGEEFGQLAEELVQLHDQHPGQSGSVLAIHAMKKHYCQAHGVPDDFPVVLRAACDSARQKADRSVSRRFVEWERDDRLHRGSAQEYSPIQELELGTRKRLDIQMSKLSAQCAEGLPRCQSMHSVVLFFDKTIDNMISNTFFAASEPALLLAMQDYIDTFSRQLQKEFRQRGKPVFDMEECFHALKSKCAHGYESYRIARDWSLQATEGKWNDLGKYAIAAQCAHLGKDFAALTDDDKQEIVAAAKEAFRSICREQGIDDDLAHPFTPLLFEASMKHAARMHTTARPLVEPLHFTSLVQESPRARRKVLADLGDDSRAEIYAMGLDLLDKTMEMFPGGARTATALPRRKHPVAVPRAPEISADALGEAMEFFNHGEARGRVN